MLEINFKNVLRREVDIHYRPEISGGGRRADAQDNTAARQAGQLLLLLNRRLQLLPVERSLQ